MSGFVGAFGQLAQLLGIAEGATAGALEPLLAQLENAGLGDRVRSWAGYGPPLPVAPHELARAFTPEQVSQWAAQAGTTPDAVLMTLSDHLPQAAVRASPAEPPAALRSGTPAPTADAATLRMPDENDAIEPRPKDPR